MPGAQILVTTPDGRQVQVQVPAGVTPGQAFQVQVMTLGAGRSLQGMLPPTKA